MPPTASAPLWPNALAGFAGSTADLTLVTQPSLAIKTLWQMAPQGQHRPAMPSVRTLYAGLGPSMLSYAVPAGVLCWQEQLYRRAAAVALPQMSCEHRDEAALFTAGMVNTLALVGPLERVMGARTMLADSLPATARVPTSFHVAADLVRTQGWRSPWRGSVPLVAREQIFAHVYLGKERMTRAVLSEDFREKHPTLTYVFGPVVFGTLGGLASTPADAVKTRMQLAPDLRPISMREAVRRLAVDNGGVVRGLMRGATPRTVMYVGGCFAFDWAQKTVLRAVGGDKPKTDI